MTFSSKKKQEISSVFDFPTRKNREYWDAILWLRQEQQGLSELDMAALGRNLIVVHVHREGSIVQVLLSTPVKLQIWYSSQGQLTTMQASPHAYQKDLHTWSSVTQADLNQIPHESNIAGHSLD